MANKNLTYKEKMIILQDKLYKHLQKTRGNYHAKQEDDEVATVAVMRYYNEFNKKVNIYNHIDFYFDEYELIKVSAMIDMESTNFDQLLIEYEEDILQLLNDVAMNHPGYRAFTTGEILGVVYFPKFVDGIPAMADASDDVCYILYGIIEQLLKLEQKYKKIIQANKATNKKNNKPKNTNTTSKKTTAKKDTKKSATKKTVNKNATKKKVTKSKATDKKTATKKATTKKATTKKAVAKKTSNKTAKSNNKENKTKKEKD